MDEYPRTILAYSVNVGGSLLGIWLFVLLSAFEPPPLTWLLAAAVFTSYFIYHYSEKKTRDVLTLGLILALSYFAAKEPGALEVKWSPYQKLVISSQTNDEQAIGEYAINVNNADYQEILDLSSEHVRADRERYPAAQEGLSQYDVPFLLHPKPEKALLVGAGSGNDASGALRNGVKEITAVDIDPVIIELGKKYHPEQPYADSAVTVVNDDARSFFATTDEKYDVIVFGLLDSHTMTAMTNARLDHYVYTEESLRHAKSLLKDGGIMVLSFFSTRQFVSDRMAGTLRKVFGEDPVAFPVLPSNYGRGCAMFVAGNLAAVKTQISQNERLQSQIRQWTNDFTLGLTYTTRTTTDDWPYIYLKEAKIPLVYYLLGAMLILLVWYSNIRYRIKDTLKSWDTSYWHFFFLGAAFLLLEVQNISKASVVLGNTWVVNAVIISGILLMILFSNLIAARFPKLPLTPVYLGLFLVCIALYCTDISRFAFLPFATKALIVGTLTTLPMLFSGIVFIRSFARTEEKDIALGANLLGALFGALLQSVTFIVGIKALLLIVIALYFAAMLTRPVKKEVVEEVEVEPELGLACSESLTAR